MFTQETQPLKSARVYFRGGQYAAVAANCVFEAVAQAFGARTVLSNTDVVRVDLDVERRYLAEPGYV